MGDSVRVWSGLREQAMALVTQCTWHAAERWSLTLLWRSHCLLVHTSKCNVQS